MPEPTIDLDRLRQAVAVARAGSFSAAAATIPLSQPALTRNIQALEREYGIQIFRRSQAGVDLTVDGALFIASAERLLKQVEAAERELRDISQGNRSIVSFGLGPATATLFLKDILSGLVDTSSTVRYRVRSGANALLRDLLHRGEIDFYVGGIPDQDLTSGSLIIEPIVKSTRLEAMVRPGHPLRRGTVSRERLAAYPIVTPPFALSLLDGMATDKFGVLTPSIEVDDFGALIEFTKMSDAVLLTSSAFTPQIARLGLVPLPSPLTQYRRTGYGLVQLAARPLARSARAAADHVVSVLSRLTEAGGQGK